MARTRNGPDSLCNDCGENPKHGKRAYCKECRNERERKKYADTPFEIRSKKQLDKYYRNLENRKECNKRVMREWRKRNPDRVIAYNQKFREENPGYQDSWRKNNPSKAKAMWDNRRAREMNAEGFYTDKDWSNIVYRQQSCCMSCGIFCNLTVDHIYPLSRGGTNWPENIQGLCKPCNSSKSARTNYQFVIPF